MGVGCLCDLGDHCRREPSREEVGTPELPRLVGRGLGDATGGRHSGRAYMPREVFFGGLGLAGAFSVFASDFTCFFAATLNSFR